MTGKSNLVPGSNSYSRNPSLEGEHSRKSKEMKQIWQKKEEKKAVEKRRSVTRRKKEGVMNEINYIEF